MEHCRHHTVCRLDEEGAPRDRRRPLMLTVRGTAGGDHKGITGIPGPMSRRKKDRLTTFQTCLFAFLGGCWMWSPPCGGLAPPPHERACPGPLDGGNSALCAVRGNASFVSAIHEVPLSSGRALIRLSRTGGFRGPGEVNYETVNNSARAGIEFVGAEGVVSWSTRDGQDRVIVVYLIDSGQYFEGRFVTNFTVRLFNPSGISLGSIVETEVRILNTNAETGQLNLPTANAVVDEKDGTVVVNVSRIGGADCDTTVQYRTVAIPGSDYGHYGLDSSSQTGSLFWREGDSSDRTISIPIRDTAQLQNEPGEEFYIEIYDSTCASLGVDRVRVIVTDDEQVGELQVVTPTVAVRSDAGTAVVTISRVNGAATPVSVDYFTVAGTAVEGTDFTATSGQLIWQHAESGERSVTIPVFDVIGNGLLEKTLTLQLAYLTGIEIDDGDYSVDVTIVNTFANPGSVGFIDYFSCRGANAPSAVNCFYVFERENRTTVEVTRFGVFDGAVSVAYSVSNASAGAAGDFFPTTGVLSWESGDDSSRFITVEIKPDAATHPILEYIAITLTNADELIPVVNVNRSVLYVGMIDDDGGGSITIEAERALVNESDLTASFIIRRSGSAVGDATANWQTVDGDALAGVDYVRASDVVSWSDGDSSSRTVTIELISDGASRLGLQFKHFFVSITAFTVNTFADPRSETAAVYVVDDGARSGFLLFPGVEFDPVTNTLTPETASYTIEEGIGVLSLIVMRKDGLEGNVSIKYRTADVTATDGAEYIGVSGELYWEEGDNSNRTVNVTIIDDNLFAALAPSRSFSFTLFGFRLTSQGFTSRNYQGPARAKAIVNIVDDDGGGVLGFVAETVEVDEAVGTVSLWVSREGGTNFNISVEYATQAGSAATPLLVANGSSFAAASFPTSCDGAVESGLRLVAGAGGVVREVFCEVNASTGAVSASIFHWDLSASLWDRECVTVGGSAGTDSSMLWSDLQARVSTAATDTTDGAVFESVQTGRAPSTAAALTPRPATVGDRARPVAFPLHDKTVWFDWQNEQLVWTNVTGMQVQTNFSDLGINGTGGMEDSANDFYFITDGIASVHVGARSELEQGASAVLLSFAWTLGTVTWRAVRGLELGPEGWCTNAGDAFGHMLWTVNGRVLYRNCSAVGSEAAVSVVLGGPIEDPMYMADQHVLMRCRDDLFEDCEGWEVALGSNATGLDLFSHVDEAGFVYFGDRGEAGGLFGCGDGVHYGTVRTGIEHGRAVANDFVPTSGVLEWAAGDTSNKAITVSIVADGVVDERVLESFQVLLSSARGSAVDPARASVTVVIEDVDGAGKIVSSIAANQSTPVRERETCCVNCGPAFALFEQQWCTDFAVQRTGGRGAVCVQYELVGSSQNETLTAEEGVHFLNQSGTLCWGNNDTHPKTVTAYLPYHQQYDVMHKTFALRLVAIAAGLDGARYQPYSTVDLGPDVVQTIEDEDMAVGFFTFRASTLTGMSVFAYNDQQPSALLIVERIGGTDLEVAITVATVPLPAGTNSSVEDARIAVQVPVTVQDGSRGTNSFCISDDYMISGACVDSSSSITCGEGECTAIVEVEASAAAPGASVYDESAEYLSLEQTLRWSEGDDGLRGVTIPLLYGEGGGNISASYRFFAVQLVSARIGSGGVRLSSSAPLAGLIPAANSVSECDAAACTLLDDDAVIAQCDAFSCRDSATSEAIVALPSFSGSGTIRLVNTTYFVTEAIPSSSLLFPVKRFGGAAGIVSVQYRVVPVVVPNVSVAAIPVAEFANVSGTLRWRNGERDDRVISVTIENDALYQRGRVRKSFAVQLFNPQGGVALSEASREAIAIIVDDDANTGVIQMHETRITVSENASIARIEAVRVGGSDLDVYVRFHTGLLTRWSTPTEQTGNATAHSKFLAEQSYACQTTLDGSPTASVFTTLRGGGGPELAFDRDPNTFWDASNSNSRSEYLQYDFARCQLLGAKVTGYTFYTRPNSLTSGCPNEWSFQASNDGFEWVTLDSRGGRSCTPGGQAYSLLSGDPGFYRYYRWLFTRDVQGFVGIRLDEVVLEFEDAGVAGSNLLQKSVCNAEGVCCRFGGADCDGWSGSSYERLRDVSYDFEFDSTVLRWEEGDESVKMLEVLLVDDCMGCSEATCPGVDQLQDKPLETMPLQLTIPSDREIRELTGEVNAIFPFRKDAAINANLSTATIVILDDDGPGVLELRVLSCGDVKGGTGVDGFTSAAGETIASIDAGCPVLESAGTVDFLVSRVGGSRGSVSVNYTVEGLTAVAGVDFDATSGQLVWSDGDSDGQRFSVRISDTPGYTTGKFNRSVIARLDGVTYSDGSSFTDGGAQFSICTREVERVCVEPALGDIEVVIIDDDVTTGTIEVDLADQPIPDQYRGRQDVGEVNVTVTRSGGSDLPIVVDYETVQIDSGEARPCVGGIQVDCEYIPVSGQLSWADGETGTRTVTITISQSEMRRNFEQFIFRITGTINTTIAFCGGYTTSVVNGVLQEGRIFTSSVCSIASASEAYVTLVPRSNTGYFELTTSSWPLVVSSDVGKGLIVISRVGGTTGIVSAQVQAVGSAQGYTAVEEINFISEIDTKTWLDGEEGPRIFRIDVLSGSVPPDTLVTMYARIIFFSPNSGVNEEKDEVRVDIKSDLYTQKFLQATVSESSLVQLDANTLTVTFQTNAVVGPGARVSITGMINSRTTNNPSLEVTGSGAEVFGFTGEWKQAGSLTLTVQERQLMEYEQVFVLSFTITNGRDEQDPRLLQISIYGDPGCEDPVVLGEAVACPEIVDIPTTTMDGCLALGNTDCVILSYSVLALAATSSSKLCTYPECPHSALVGAYNNVSVTVETPIVFEAGSRITIFGMDNAGDMSLDNGALAISVANLRVTGQTERKVVQQPCVCYAEGCACEVTFSNVLPNNATLRAQLQCNNLGWGVLGGELITVQVGADAVFASNGGGLVTPPYECEDRCEVEHDLFRPYLNISEFVSSTGDVYVAIQSTSHVDFCGKGEFLRVNLTAEWDVVGTDRVNIISNFSQTTGELTFTVPVGYEFSNEFDIIILFGLRNPLSAFAGTNFKVQVASADESVIIGPDDVSGTLLLTERAAAIASSEIGESTPVQGENNLIILQFSFNSDLGGNRDGVMVTIAGLTGSATPDNAAFPIQSCSICRFPADTYLDLSTLVPTAKWDQGLGELSFLLRGTAPDYKIDRGNIVGMIELQNPNSVQSGATPVIRVSGEVVVGATAVADTPMSRSGERDVLTAFVSMDIFSSTRFAYSSGSGYTAVDRIEISFLSARDLMYLDNIIFDVPSLTTCEVLCYDGSCRERGCGDIQGFYIDALPESTISGNESNFFLMSWNEAQSQIRLTATGGRALCAGSSFAVSFSPEDYGCREYECSLKVLPDDIGASRGENRFSTDALGCANGGPFCSPPASSSFVNNPVALQQGSYWGQGTGRIDEANGTDPVGRAGFSAQVHAGSLFVLGGIGPSGFARDVRVSTDGLSFTQAGSDPVVFGSRMLMPTVSFRGYLWVLGGRDGATGAGLNDVWKSQHGAEWCQVTTGAAWAGREQHAAIVHNGNMWVLGGLSDIGGSDVWYSSDGDVWKVATWSAAFGARSGAAAVSFRDRMWVYGGGMASDVWQSSDGTQWELLTTAPWENRKFQGGLVYDSKLWVVGGYSNQSLADVWYSDDGAQWVRATAQAQWGSRYGASAVAFNNRMWVLGGSVDACDGVGVTECPSAGNGTGCEGFFYNCTGNDAWLDSFVAIEFGELQLTASSTVRGADNTIRLDAVVDVDILSGQLLTVSPLNADMPDGEIPVYGPSARVVGHKASWDRSSQTITLSFVESLTAGNRFLISWVIVNPAEAVNLTRVVLAAEGRSDSFARLTGYTWAVFGGTDENGEYEVSTAKDYELTPMVVDGGVMFDVTAIQSVVLGGITLGLQPQAVEQPLQQEIVVYYKEGSHVTGLYNLSEWRVLGSVTVEATEDETSLHFDFLDLQSFLADGQPPITAARCPAVNHLCEDEVVCDFSQCLCQAGIEMQLPQNAIDDVFPYEYRPPEFSQGRTYCAYDNVNTSESCVNNDGDVFSCVPHIVPQQAWLGPQPTWAENTSDYMSSTLIRDVNITAVLTQSYDSMWHSGNGNGFGAEADCIHLPWCDDGWQFNKNQWLAFDLGVCYTLSAFRTSFPNYTQVPEYYLFGVRRQNIREEYWQLAHFKNFEFQYSTMSLSGPWITAIKGTADIQTDLQTFSFEPATARYWRLLMIDNYGFGYVAVQTIEMFGFESVWCHESSLCDQSPLCDVTAADRTAIYWDAAQNVRDSYGFALEAGRHAFFLRSSLALNMSWTEERRGSVHESDGRLAIHRGSLAEYHAPLFAYQADSAMPRRHVTVATHSLTSAELNSRDGFVLATRFRTARGNNNGTLLAIGHGCEGGLRVQLEGLTVRLEQGCLGGSGVVVGPVLNVTEEADYCFVVSFAPVRDSFGNASNASLQLRLERSFPLASEDAQLIEDSAVNLSAVPEFASIVVGAAASCGTGVFPGAVAGVAVYAGVLDSGALVAACRRKCPAVMEDGVCTERVNLVADHAVLTQGAVDWEFMRLPVRPTCYRYWRLRVAVSTHPMNQTQWCLREMSFFSSPQPNWIPIVVDPRQAQSSSHASDFGPSGAFDGNVTATGMNDDDREYCSAAGEDDGWLQYSFSDLTCVTGYALHGPKDVSAFGVPGSWTLQGSVDGENWKLVDSQVGQTWQKGEWKRYDVRSETEFLFVSNIMDEDEHFGYNTRSRLYGWIGEDEGWVLEQELVTRGARRATHFQVGVEHYLAVANILDSSLESSFVNVGQRATNAQVGTDLYLWADTGFVPVETLQTRNSMGLTYVNIDGRELLISADQRMVPTGERGLEYEASIVFEKQATDDDCSTTDCRFTGTCGCFSCGCYTTLETQPTSVGTLADDHDPVVAWDGDYETVWTGDFNSSGYRLAYVNNMSDTNFSTASLGLAVQLNFTKCSPGAMVTYYSIVTTEVNCPFGWELQGGSETEWTVLDVQTEQTCSGTVQGQRQAMSFQVEEPGKYPSYRLVFRLETNFSNAVLNGTASADNTTVEIADIGFVFDNQNNLALLEDDRGNSSFRSFDFEPQGPPFLSVYRDTDGYPVPALRYSEFPLDGALGPLDVEFLGGSVVADAGCSLGGNDPTASWANDPLAPWRSCVAAPDLCEPMDQGICFQGNSTGVCLAGNNSGALCESDVECGDRGTCAPQRRYAYKIKFKYVVRLLSLRMRGCGWCTGIVDVLDESGTLLSRRAHDDSVNCSACNAWSLRINRIGREFIILEDSFAPLLVRSAISLEWEPTSGWEQVQLIPTHGAMDVTPYVVGSDWFIAIANLRANQHCFGDVGCANPPGSAKLVSDNVPYNINSQILWYDGSSFQPVQNIPTLGALDFEFFVISGQQYLAVANSFDSSLSTASVDSVVYKLSEDSVPCNQTVPNCTGPSHAWVPFQHIPTVEARKWSYFQKDGKHFLALACGANEETSHLSSSSLYVWNGRRFDKLTSITNRPATDVEVFEIDGATFFAIATTAEGESLAVNSSILRWADAAEFHGVISFTDAYAPSARFPVRDISSASTVADEFNNITVTISPDRTLPAGTLLSISGLTATNTVDGVLDVFGPASARFGNEATWVGAESCVVLNVTTDLLGEETLNFYFFLRNGYFIQPPVRAAISCSGRVSALPMTMNGRVLEVDTLPELAVTLEAVLESSSVQRAVSNVVTISFRANFDLVPGTEVQIVGLVGLAKKSDYLTVAYETDFVEISGDAADRFGIETDNTTALARWNQTSGVVSTDVLRVVSARTTVSLSMTFVNGDTAQTAVGVAVRLVNISNSSVIAATSSASDTILGFQSAPAMQVAKVTQSHTRRGVTNRLYVTLRPSVPLVKGQTITIGGLVNTPMTDGLSIDIGGSHRGRFQGSPSFFANEIGFVVGPNCRAVCQNGDCLVSSQPCQFPFDYNSVARSECTTDGNPTQLWCATQDSIADPINPSTPGWGYCDCSATIPSDEDTTFWIDVLNPVSLETGIRPTIIVRGSISIGSSGMTDGDGNAASILGSAQGMPALNLTQGLEIVSTPGMAWPDELEQLTVEMWLKEGGGSPKELLSIDGDTVRVSVLDGGAGEVTMTILGTATTFSSIGVDDGSWHHLAFSWKSASGTLSVWLDGFEHGNTVVRANDTLSIANANISLGAASNPAGEHVALAEVRVWSVARGDADANPTIHDTFDDFISAAPRPASLLALYAFDPSVGVGMDGSVYARHLNVSASDVVDVGDQRLQGYVYPVPSFTVAVASSTTAYPGGDACVSVGLKSDVDLGPGAQITVFNLEALEPLPPLIPILSDFTAQAVWDPASRSMTMTLNSPVQVDEWFNFSFSVALPQGVSAPRTLMVQARDGSSLSYGDEEATVGQTTVTGAVLESSSLNLDGSCPTPAWDAAPFWEGSTCPTHYGCPEESLVSQTACACSSLCPSGAWKRPPPSIAMTSATDPWLNMLSVSASTVLAGVDNIISVAMQPDREIPAGSQLTISGLVTTLTTDRDAGPLCAITGSCFLELDGPDAAKFELFTGQWRQSGGVLMLTLSDSLLPYSPTRFSFRLKNPSTAQPAVYPDFEVSGRVPIPPSAACDGTLEVAEPAAFFELARVSESTCVPCQQNEIRVSLAPSVAITANSTVTVSGLDGTLSPAGTVPLTGPDAHMFVQGLGYWSGGEVGTLETTLAFDVPQSTVIVLSWAVHNNRKPQLPRTPYIALSVPAYHPPGTPPPPAVRASGSVLSFAASDGDYNSTASSQWMATGWTGYYGSGIDWIEGASGTCCAGSCCPRWSCCSCSSLRTSGVASLRDSGVYFQGSPCEVYCDMDTDGGGWTLVASLSASDAPSWLIRANVSDQSDLQNQNVPNLWEAQYYTVGDSPADPNRDADFRSWAFFEPAGDGMGAGDQLMITFGNSTTTSPVPLLQTDRGCLGELPMAVWFADLPWNCTFNRTGPLLDLARSESSEDNKIPGPDPCSHACPIVAGQGWGAWAGEAALLDGDRRKFLFLKAGTEGGPYGADADTLADFAYLSTEARGAAGRGRGLGSLCSGPGCGVSPGTEGVGEDIGGAAEGSAGVWYSIWVRRDGWKGECVAPLWREGEACGCCWCAAGYSSDGAKCVPCQRGRYKAVAGTHDCEACGGTDNLAPGQTECPQTIEVLVETALRAPGGGGVEEPSYPWVSVQYLETGEWTDRIYLQPSRSDDDLLPAGAFGVPQLTDNTTARVLADGLTVLPLDVGVVGTPAAVRYGMAERANTDAWTPRRVAVRANGGRWFHIANETLLTVDAVCVVGQACALGVAVAEYDVEGLGDEV